MIVELNEMIDYIEEFLENDYQATCVGGIVGTPIEKIVLETITAKIPWHKVLVIQGCQDYTGLMKKRLTNVLFWGDVIIEENVEPLREKSPWMPEIFSPQPEFTKKVDASILVNYDIIVILNAHLIPMTYRYDISMNFAGKVVYIIDPFETDYSVEEDRDERTPVIVDSLNKLSPLQAMARAAVGFDTRAIDTKVRGTLTELNRINRRSIGKMDDKQYVTNDWDLYVEIQNKQKNSPFRKNQKVIIEDDIIDIMMDDNGLRKATLTRNSMLVIDNPNSNPLMKLRLYNSKIIYSADITYDFDNHGPLKRRGILNVRPANILRLHDVKYHRFNHIVFIMNDRLAPSFKYTLLKNSNNVTIINKIR